MLNPTSSYTDAAASSIVAPTFHVRESRRPSRGLTPARSDAPIPADEVVARHTATRAHDQLNSAYLRQSLATGLPLLAVDTVVTASMFLVTACGVNALVGFGFASAAWVQLPALLLFQIGLLSIHHLYPGAGVSPVEELRGIVRSTLLAFIILAAMNVLFGKLSRLELSVFLCAAVFIALTLPLMRYLVRESLSKTKWWGIRTLFLGNRQDCAKMMQRLNTCRNAGYIPVDSVILPSNQAHPSHDAWAISADAFELATRIQTPVATLVSPEAQELGDRLIFKFPSIVWIDFDAAHEVNTAASDLIGTFARRMSMPLLRFTPRAVKRCLDLAICIPVLLIMAIPMAAIALCIKLVSPGPVIYGSPRVGQHGRKFQMWKLRSMVVNADEVLKQKLLSDPQARAEWDQNAKLKDDPRVIPRIGPLIRRYSLDELPQLWNVLTGEMSIVGPRPVPPDEIVRYQNHYYEYTKMWPGMTGLWQVSGRNETTFSTRVYLVRHYATNWSLWLDAWILAKTPIVVIARKGAY